MSNKYYHVTGVKTLGSTVPPRLEFNQFAEDVDVLNLYLLALREIQCADQSKLTSHFQVAGIHGKPYQPWDGVQGQDSYDFGGYCTHGSVIFPTWHRPYVALYEQVVWEEARKIANSYERHDLKIKYQEASRRLRQPYYDWAVKPNTIHPLLNSIETVKVFTAPHGEMEHIPNPLFGYKFHPIDPSFEDRFAIWRKTVRHPASTTDPDAKSQPEEVESVKDMTFFITLSENNDQIRDLIFDLLAYNHDWMTMSNRRNGQGANNLEEIHDDVHLYIGEQGHMGDVPMAAFDPIFFLHHTNVDRMLALWQALNPDLWVVPGPSQEGSFTVPPNESVDTYTDLTPFHVDDYTFWKSESVRDMKAFGYTYPEIGSDVKNPEELREAVMKAVMKLYGPIFDVSQDAVTATALAQSKSKSVVNTSSNPGHGAASGTSPTYPARYYDWFATVTVNPAEFARSGHIFIFLSEKVPSGDYLHAPERAGDVAIFKNSSDQCANCKRRQEEGETVSGQVPLTRILLGKGKDINDVEGIKEYLKTHMHWRCALVGGTELPLENVPSLQVKLFSALCQKGERRGGFEGFPTRQAPEVHRSVTHGKVGGYIADSD